MSASSTLCNTKISMLSARTLLHNPPHNTPVDELDEGGLPQMLQAHIIDCFAHNLRVITKEANDSGEGGKSYVFDTTFWDSLKAGNKTLKVGNDAPCDNVLHLDHLYVAIVEDLHYKLVYIHLKKKLASVYDSTDHGILRNIFRQNFE